MRYINVNKNGKIEVFKKKPKYNPEFQRINANEENLAILKDLVKECQKVMKSRGKI